MNARLYGVDTYPTIFKKCFGRILHDLDLALSASMSLTHLDMLEGEDDLIEGYKAQQKTLRNSLIRECFRKKDGGNKFNVKGIGFKIIIHLADNERKTYYIPAGIVDTAYFGAFPYAVGIVFDNGVFHRCIGAMNPVVR